MLTDSWYLARFLADNRYLGENLADNWYSGTPIQTLLIALNKRNLSKIFML